MKIRTKKVLSLLLAASMVLGMNTMAFGDEIAEVADTATVAEDTGAKVAAATAGSDNGAGGGGFLRGTDGKFITTIAYNPDSSKKNAKNNLAVITNTTDPVSWNNLNGAELIATVLFGGEADDEYLNNTDKTKVSKNGIDYTGSNFPTNIVDKGWGYEDTDWVFRSIPVDQSAGVYALVGYQFDDNDSNNLNVKGEWAYQDETVAPYFDVDNSIGGTYETSSRVTSIPVTTWSGRTIGLNKNGENKYDADKKNIKNIDVAASLVKFDNGTVTELEDLEVKSIKWKDKKALKQASVKLDTSKVEVTSKTKNDDGKIVEGEKFNVYEHDVIGTLPEFTIKVKAKNKDAKKYKKSFKNTLDKETFKVGIMQKAIVVTDPTGDDDILNEFVKYGKYNGHFTVDGETGVKLIPASQNGPSFKEMVNDINEWYSNAMYTDESLKPGRGAIGGLTITKFDAKKSAKGTIVLRNDIFKKGVRQAGKTADITLKKGKDYDFETGTLAGETVYVLDLKGDNYVYAKNIPSFDYTDLEGKDVYKVKDNDLSSFGFKWAFRVDPKDKKTFRYGIYADTNAGFVFGK